MHELGLSEGLLATVVDVAGDRPVTRVRVSIGALQRVVPDSLEFGFRLVAEGTVCEAATLEIHPLPVRVRCRACGVESRSDEEPVGCPVCGAGTIEMLGRPFSSWIGTGGVRSAADVKQYLGVGASLVAMGTGALADPRLPERIVQDLERSHG